MSAFRRVFESLYSLSLRVSRPSLALVSFLSYVIVMGYWIAPRYFTNFEADAQVNKSSELKAVISEVVPLAATPSPGGEPNVEVKYVSVTYNPLLNVEVAIRAVQGQSEVELRYLPKLRLDNFILFTGVWGVATLALTVLNRNLAAVKISGLEFAVGMSPDVPDAEQVARRVSTTGFPSESQKVAAEEFLAVDVSNALKRATELFTRSTLMLVSGVVMAFIGVAIFYVTLPQFQPGEASSAYLEKGIRPTGMLIFVEGIAWFLLRQYRALIEDYKTFHLLYLKRANYLIALKTLSIPEVSQPQIFLAATMMSEDLTGRLKAGETTENIEGVKAIEPNPVFTLFQALLETVKKK